MEIAGTEINGPLTVTFKFHLDRNRSSREARRGELEQPLRSTDWLQTAEVLESLDLLVSVDTSVAHLAGALGIPVVLMLSAPADWRWGQISRKTFLYDSFRLVRCSVPGDWSEALKQADLEVNNWLLQ